MHFKNDLELTDLKKTNFKSVIRSWKSSVMKDSTKQWNTDLIEKVLGSWNASKLDYKQLSSSNIGHGSQSSTLITKDYDAIYVIKDIEIIFGGSRDAAENFLNSFWKFRRDKLVFDWINGILIVNGKFTEKWD